MLKFFPALMLETGLQDFLSFLNGLKSADFKGNQVDQYLKTYRIRAEDLFPFTHFRKDNYGRNLVMKTELYELLILSWMPNQRTPVHDHANQRCWMIMEAGELCFKNYETPKEEGACCLVAKGPTETHRKGEAVYIDDSMGVHSIANTSKESAVSLHLYAGPVPRCRIYNETTKTFQWVDLTYYTTPGRLPFGQGVTATFQA